MNHIPVNEPLFDGNEKKYLMECIDTGWISSDGPFVKQFEEKFATRVGRKYGIAVSNGSVALDTAIIALGLGHDDEVIMPTFTIISCAAAIVRAGATPVLVDSDPITWNMDVNQIEAKITPKTKAIMVVHLYGLPVDMDPILTIAQTYKLKIIEDAAQMHGQMYKNRPCGSFGEISTFSFYPNKHITTGEGGMLVTDNPEIAEHCRSLRNLCFKPERRFLHDTLGFNFRMTNLQAALGLAQLEQLDTFIAKKRISGALYSKLFEGEEKNIQIPCKKTNYAENIYWIFGIVLQETIPFDALQALLIFEKKNIGTRPFFWCMHEQPVFKKMGLFIDEHYPVAERMARRGLYLPSGMKLTEEQINNVANITKKIFSSPFFELDNT